MSNWNRTQTLALITLYEQHPVLYNTKSEEFLDRIKKNDVLARITRSLKASRPLVTQEEVKSKLKTLRNQYIREKKAHANSKKSGSGADQVHMPKLWCFNELKFLDKFVKSTPSFSNIQQSNDEHFLDESDTVLVEDAAPQSNGKKKKSLDVQICRSLCAVEEMAERMRDRREKTSTPQYLLGKMVENELNGITEHFFLEAKWKIMNIFQEIQKKSYASRALPPEYQAPPEYHPPPDIFKCQKHYCESQTTPDIHPSPEYDSPPEYQPSPEYQPRFNIYNNQNMYSETQSSLDINISPETDPPSEYHTLPEYQPPSKMRKLNDNFEINSTLSDFHPVRYKKAGEQATPSYVVIRSAVPKPFIIKHEKPKILNVQMISQNSKNLP